MTGKHDKTTRGWTRLLNPKELRSNLVRASVFLAAYEFLKQALIKQPEDFFAEGFDANGPILGEEYRSKVLSLHEMPFFASAIWFRNAGAIVDADLNKIREIREHRNFIAHNIPVILSSVDSDIRTDLLRSIVDIVGKIDIWWIREVEIPTNPDFDATPTNDIDYRNTFSFRVALLELFVQVADGNDKTLMQLYELFSQG